MKNSSDHDNSSEDTPNNEESTKNDDPNTESDTSEAVDTEKDNANDPKYTVVVTEEFRDKAGNLLAFGIGTGVITSEESMGDIPDDSANSSGKPSKVNSDKYRAGWDNIFKSPGTNSRYN